MLFGNLWRLVCFLIIRPAHQSILHAQAVAAGKLLGELLRKGEEHAWPWPTDDAGHAGEVQIFGLKLPKEFWGSLGNRPRRMPDK